MTSLYVLGRGLVDPTEPVLRADDVGILRGDGLFETLRVQGGRAVLLDAHLDRMDRGAERIGLVVPEREAWAAAAVAAIAAYDEPTGLLKLLCTRGPEGGSPVAYAMVLPTPPATVRGREEGIHAVCLTLGVGSGAKAAAPWLLGGVKTTSYAVNMAAIREAQSRGFDDAIWVGSDGEVLEAPTSNVAWVLDGVITSPPAEEVGVLRGTTLDALLDVARLDGVTVEIRPGHVNELRSAAEVFLTSSVRGVAPVLTLDGVAVSTGGVGPITAALRSAYEEICASGR